MSDQPVRAARVSTVSNLAEATFSTTTIQGWRRIGKQAAFDRICGTAAISRGWGDCYGHALAATGRVDVMIDPLLNPWDCAPFIPILQEAGGAFVDFNGEVRTQTGNGLSVNAGLKDQVLKLLSDN
jgi:histidinol-phosphatase